MTSGFLALLRDFAYRVLARIRRPAFERELDEEMAFHEDMLVADAMHDGMAPAEARRHARRRFGSRLRVREGARDAWSFGGLERLTQDARYAARFLRRRPAFTLVALLSLGVGVGANTAVFTVLDRLLVRPPSGVVDDGSLRRIYFRWTYIQPGPNGALHQTTDNSEFVPLFAIAAQSPAVKELATYTLPWPQRIGRDLDARQAKLSRVSGNFFPMLGVVPALGRLLKPEDDIDGVIEAAAVISWAWWQREFGGDSTILGRRIEFIDYAVHVVGVAPRGFTGVEMDAADIWIPVAPGMFADYGSAWRTTTPGPAGHQAIVRRAPGATNAEIEAQATVAALGSQGEEARAFRTPQVMTGPLIRARGPGDAEPAVKVVRQLSLAALLVLVAACANVANLLFVRALARKREIAFRLAVGVSRARLISQLVLEGLLIGIGGAVVAVAMAWWGGQLIRSLLFPDHSWVDGPVNVRILVFALACAALTSLLAALIPAWRMSRPALVESLRAGSNAGGRGGVRLQGAFLALQAALSITLLIGAGLFARSLQRAATFDIGFARDSLVGIQIRTWDETPVARAALNALYAEIAGRLRGVPGVVDVSLTSMVTLAGGLTTSLRVPGLDTTEVPLAKYTAAYAVDEHFLETTGMRLTGGRGILETDRSGSEAVVLVNATLAKRVWPGTSPIGRCLMLGTDSTSCRTVVGTIADFHTMRLREEPVNIALVPLAQAMSAKLFSLSEVNGITVRVASDPTNMAASLREVVRESAGPLRSLRVRPVEQSLDYEMRPWRLGSTMFGLFAVLTLVLAAVGLFGTVAFSVTQRTTELGIRSALGARWSHLAGLVVGTTAIALAVGIGCGVVVSAVGSRLVADLLFETPRHDVASYAGAILILLIAGAVAAAIPARRAACVDPALALRAE